jgi:hypothetical protein
MLLGLNIIVLKIRDNTFQSNTIQLISLLIKIGHVITDHFFWDVIYVQRINRVWG